MKSFMKALVEIATVCPKKMGYDFILQVRSDDNEPAHMHMLDLNGNEITRILLSNKLVDTIDDIKEYPNDPHLSIQQKKKLLEWAKEKSKVGLNNWLRAIDIWDMYQDDKIDG